MCQKEFLLFYMCQLWALHVVTKPQFFYIYYVMSQDPVYDITDDEHLNTENFNILAENREVPAVGTMTRSVPVAASIHACSFFTDTKYFCSYTVICQPSKRYRFTISQYAKYRY